jgi:hypothetical protein
MADPRGRGFKRGRGRWHAQPIRPTHPADVGFRYCYMQPEENQPVYEYGEAGVFLMYSPYYTAWMLAQRDLDWIVLRGYTLTEIANIASGDSPWPELSDDVPFDGEPAMAAAAGPEDCGLVGGVDY